MDVFTTSLRLADVDIPHDRIIDGINLLPVLFHNERIERSIFYYRGDEMMAVRYGLYKAHYWTWSNPIQEHEQYGDVCPGECVANVTTHDLVNHTLTPILFHLGRDPGEKYPISSEDEEYKIAMKIFEAIVDDHKAKMKRGIPQLDMCDVAAMNWAPPGCESIGKCLKIPPSQPKRCVWKH